MGAPTAAIVDYRLGNLFSIQQACAHAGLQAAVTSSAEEIRAADAVILPGVGAFGDAMETLRGLGSVEVLREIARGGKPLMGICLGMQLLMSESAEFGRHEGLGIIPGDVVRLAPGLPELKVPHVGWNRIIRAGSEVWDGTLLEETPDGTAMYFVHSYYVRPVDPGIVLSRTRYGQLEFCSSLRRERVFACQFHPERSGPDGLRVYQAFARQIAQPAAEAAHG